MRKLGSRISLLVFLLMIVTLILSLVLSALVRNGVIFLRDPTRYMWFGFAFRDILLLVLVTIGMIISILSVSRSTTQPIRKVTDAMKQVAAGDFDVQVSLRQENVEEFGALQNGFNMMVRDLKGNAYLRQDFMSNVSHELKTPLSIINGYARLMEEGGLSDEESREYAGYISRESSRLIKLTSDMLRLSTMDGAGVEPDCTEFDLGEQIRSAILLLEPQWSGKGIDVSVDLCETKYCGDADLLSQVWLNLIGNAVKYTQEGGKIEVRLTAAEDGVSVLVSDNGAGMTQYTLNHMFEMFYQGDESHKREGSGLGLAIVKRIVELHGGSVTAVSSPGAGSAFTVKLPAEQGQQTKNSSQRRTQRKNAAHGGRRARRPRSDNHNDPEKEN